ncbi:MAG: NAD(P)H-hydrate epimerase [Candidatus Omnitrophota bacterium]
MMKPVTAAIMAEIDRRAQEDYGIAPEVLMENAGRSAAEVILSDIESLKYEKIVVFCGKGNNGGDGFVIARYLADEAPAGLKVAVTDMDNVKKGPAYDNFVVIRKMGLDICPMKDIFKNGSLGDITVGIDSVFGTGFSGELPVECAGVFNILNNSRIRLYAVDVPSGLDATTGEAAKGCLKAWKTITFGLPKLGFLTGEGPRVCGEVVVKNIGFPLELLKAYQ